MIGASKAKEEAAQRISTLQQEVEQLTVRVRDSVACKLWGNVSRHGIDTLMRCVLLQLNELGQATEASQTTDELEYAMKENASLQSQLHDAAADIARFEKQLEEVHQEHKVF